MIGLDLAESVEPQPDVLEQPRVVPLDQLGPDDAGVGAVELLHQQQHPVGVERDVVVEETEEAAVAFDEAQHLVGGGAVAAIDTQVTDERLGEEPLDAGGQIAAVGVGRPGQQEQRVEVGVVLARQCREGLVEPRAGLVDDDDGHDGWRERGGGVHGGPRLSPPLSRFRHHSVIFPTARLLRGGTETGVTRP